MVKSGFQQYLPFSVHCKICFITDFANSFECKKIMVLLRLKTTLIIESFLQQYDHTFLCFYSDLKPQKSYSNINCQRLGHLKGVTCCDKPQEYYHPTHITHHRKTPVNATFPAPTAD